MIAIDWNSFTPWSALLGGALIGLAASILVLFNGRVFGISGLLSGTWSGAAGDKAWRWMALLGLAAAPWVYRLAGETVPVVQSPALGMGRGGGLAGGLWNPFGLRLYQWARRMRFVAFVASFSGGDADVYGQRFSDRVCFAPSALRSPPCNMSSL